MEQLDLFTIIDRKKDMSMKRVEVEIIKSYNSKAILVYRVEGTTELVKQSLAEYFERVKDVLGIKKYKFLNIEEVY
ncbi:hypothetical protein [Clostridium sp.]|uniref:hypothetical protein n=1 Tax=Clostridium sp. TaxID=1506 RepID=UPI00290F0FF1|nr:hypothetical protein [Clostridium sp.]MDU3323777.1 hypothetical protein [Escherichia coli]MDU3411001.1 hypothetical protein [Clostridium sp.]